MSRGYRGRPNPDRPDLSDAADEMFEGMQDGVLGN